MTTKQIFWRLNINSTFPGTNAGHQLQDMLQPVRREHATFGMPGQRTACAATLGMHSVKRLYKSRNNRKKW